MDLNDSGAVAFVARRSTHNGATGIFRTDGNGLTKLAPLQPQSTYFVSWSVRAIGFSHSGSTCRKTGRTCLRSGWNLLSRKSLSILGRRQIRSPSQSYDHPIIALCESRLYTVQNPELYGTRMGQRHKEQHRTERIGWLRGAVLGANDGIFSTASLIVGVASA